MEKRLIERIFEYSGMRLNDPDPTMNPEDVKRFYTAVYPELSQAVIEEPVRRGDTLVYAIKRAVGTKGGGQSPPITVQWLAEIDAEKTIHEPMQGGIGCPHRLLTQLFGERNQSRETGEVVLPSERLPLLP
ncbi:MAG: PRTRC system protein C [Nitrospiria bacterium]